MPLVALIGDREVPLNWVVSHSTVPHLKCHNLRHLPLYPAATVPEIPSVDHSLPFGDLARRGLMAVCRSRDRRQGERQGQTVLSVSIMAMSLSVSC